MSDEEPMPLTAYLLVLCVAMLCYAALGAVLGALPSHTNAELHAGAAVVGIGVGAPAFTAVLCRPFGGRLADRHGPVALVRAGALVMALGVAPAFVQGSVPAFIASRLAVGAGEGVMMSATALWLLRLAGPARRGRALGHVGLANYAGLTLGPLLALALGASNFTLVLIAAALLPLLAALASYSAAHLHPRSSHESHAAASSQHAGTRALIGLTLPAGIALMLVNVGYVALLGFGGSALRAHGVSIASLIVPLFAGGVIVGRTLLGGIPDRYGGRPVACIAAVVASAGLLAIPLAHSSLTGVLAVLVLALGQALTVPALGLIALAGVPRERHGAAAGLFFAWFDAGVGLGGPFTGAVAELSGAQGAMFASSGAVLAVVPAVLIGGLWQRTRARSASQALDGLSPRRSARVQRSSSP